MLVDVVDRHLVGEGFASGKDGVASASMREINDKRQVGRRRSSLRCWGNCASCTAHSPRKSMSNRYITSVDSNPQIAQRQNRILETDTCLHQAGEGYHMNFCMQAIWFL